MIHPSIISIKSKSWKISRNFSKFQNLPKNYRLPNKYLIKPQKKLQMKLKNQYPFDFYIVCGGMFFKKLLKLFQKYWKTFKFFYSNFLKIIPPHTKKIASCSYTDWFLKTNLSHWNYRNYRSNWEINYFK